MSGGEIAAGIDVAEPRKGLDLVALDGDRGIVHQERRLSLRDMCDRIAALRPAVVCIDSPPAWAVAGRSRAAERALAKLRISAFCTPCADREAHPFYAWMRAGFAVFDALACDYPLYRGGAVRGFAAEVFPNASAVLLAGRARGAGESKRVFRRMVLEAQGVDQRSLRSLDSVDAALAALTGRIALDGGHCAVGDPREGTILLPVPSPQLLPHVPPAAVHGRNGR